MTVFRDLWKCIEILTVMVYFYTVLGFSSINRQNLCVYISYSIRLFFIIWLKIIFSTIVLSLYCHCILHFVIFFTSLSKVFNVLRTSHSRHPPNSMKTTTTTMVSIMSTDFRASLKHQQIKFYTFKSHWWRALLLCARCNTFPSFLCCQVSSCVQ